MSIYRRTGTSLNKIWDNLALTTTGWIVPDESGHQSLFIGTTGPLPCCGVRARRQRGNDDYDVRSLGTAF